MEDYDACVLLHASSTVCPLSLITAVAMDTWVHWMGLVYSVCPFQDVFLRHTAGHTVTTECLLQCKSLCYISILH